jgi:hypothetical protein
LLERVDPFVTNQAERVVTLYRQLLESWNTRNEVRALAPGVMLLRSVLGMVPPGKDELKPDVNAIQSLVITKRDADMKVALLQNTPAAFHGRPELAQQLTSELSDVLRSGQILTTDLLPSAFSAPARAPRHPVPHH